MHENKKILLGVSGGISAFKAVGLASQLTARQACVKTVMTQSATHLVGPKSFQAVTGQPVYTSLWDLQERPAMEHMDLAQWADTIVIAPATANIMAKAAHGICDCLLSTLLCACWQGPVLLAPAMNTRMWNNPVTQKNVAALKEIGFKFVGPTEGRLACGEQGIGRMAEPEQIIKAIESL